MKHIWAWLVGALALMAALAAFSRIVSMPQAPDYIKNGAKALAKLFNGAFGF